MASNMYRVGDYVYFESFSSQPYQIRRIEELNKTANGNVEAKVMCFFRRRDIPSTLIQLADKHQVSMDEEQAEMIGDGYAELTEEERHLYKHRELFLSRQVETVPATHIRGKCSVTLLNETENARAYLGKDDCFFYSLVYDPQQKTLLADKGEIRVGGGYQAKATDLLKEDETDSRDCGDLEELVWRPEHKLTDRQMEQFLVLARSVGTFARALDCTSTVRQPSLHMSAAAASRDITLFHAMDLMHENDYDVSKAMSGLVAAGGPVLCRDEMEEWSASEANLFEEALEKYGKDFIEIRQDFLPWKTLKSVVEYYYMWKTTDRYVQQKRVKAAENESKLKQVYIPSYNKPNANLLSGKMSETQMGGRPCEGCGREAANAWYAWGTLQLQCRLCDTCWIYWKHCGGLKNVNARTENERPPPSQRSERVAQYKQSGISMGTSQSRCIINDCGKEFRHKAHLARHLATVHGLSVRSLSPKPIMKTRAAFCLIATPLARVSRVLCKNILKPRHAARNPTQLINSLLIKQECQRRLPQAVKGSYKLGSKARRVVSNLVAKLGVNSEDRLAVANAIQSTAPSLYSAGKKRSYDTNDVRRGFKGGPAAKRQTSNAGVIRHASNLVPGADGKMHVDKSGKRVTSWSDSTEDAFFMATEVTKTLRKDMSQKKCRRVARKPWRTTSLTTRSSAAVSSTSSPNVVVVE